MGPVQVLDTLAFESYFSVFEWNQISKFYAKIRLRSIVSTLLYRYLLAVNYIWDMTHSIKPKFPEVVFASKDLVYPKLEKIFEKYDDWIIILDENTNKHCLPIFVRKLGNRPPYTHILQSGDKNKTLDRCSSIWTKLTEIRAGRNFLIVNLGGGLVSDIGGFAASCYKRGIDYINVPTTLLAMVDAAHGGKTGVNYKGFKNVIGSIYMPELVLIDQEYLSILDKHELISGYAEVLKHSLIADKDLWLKLKSIKKPDEIENWFEILEKSIEIKNNIAQKDLFDNNVRRLLNFGHSIAHALETYSHENDMTELGHGTCVAAGMIIENYISVEKGMLSLDECLEIQEVIISIFGKVDIDETMFSAIYEIIAHDKKRKGDDLNFTLLNEIGKAEFNCKAEFSEVEKALSKYSKL